MGNLIAGQAALITGGSAGIGKAAVELFAREGARVLFAARGAQRGIELARQLQAEGCDVRFVQADVSCLEDVQRLVAKTVDAFGRLDCAFNNAASLGRVALSADYSEADFDADVAANLKSVWLSMKYEIAQMLKQTPPGGAIVNTSSVNGLGGARGASLYAMAKAGVLALTKSVAQEYADNGIRANALVAGAFDTEMLHTAIEKVVGNDPAAIAAAYKGYTARVPLGRIGNPSEAAHAALWLCTSASSYVTGQSMIVDGGLTSFVR